MEFYTAQIFIAKKYKDRNIIDITVKSAGKYKAFAPTWDMVMGYKNGKINEAEYTRKYEQLIAERMRQDNGPIKNLVNEIKQGNVVLVCYCKSGDFCHRYILAELLSEVDGIKYAGELI